MSTESREPALLPPHAGSSRDVERSKRDNSPPHTPKGHPMSATSLYGTYVSAGSSSPNGSPTKPLSKPTFPSSYPRADLHHPSSYGTTLSYMMRIPRKLRPVLLLAVMLFTIIGVMLAHGMHRATDLEILRQQKLAMMHDRKFVATDLHALEDTRFEPEEGITQLNPQEELAALLAFITSTTSNALPDLDTSQPLEPSLILDFDWSSPRARSDLDIMIDDINSRYPVILVGRMRDPWHREIKKLLSSYRIRPAPLVIDVDQRLDHRTMIPLLARLFDSPTLPQLLVSLEPLGSYTDVMQLRDSGDFAAAIAASGASIAETVAPRKKGSKERQRVENERLLKPRPIK